MKKLNDIFTNLVKTIDISKSFKLKDCKIQNKFNKGIIDLKLGLSELNLKLNKRIKIHQNKTQNFDSFIVNKKNKIIDISKKLSFYEKIILGLKGKVTLSGKIIGTFNKRVYFSKNFIKNIIIIFFGLIIILGIDSFIIEYKVKSGYNRIMSLKEKTGNIKYIQNSINKAKIDFIISEIFFKPFLLIPNNNIKNGYYLLKGGKELTIFLDSLIQSYLKINNFIKQKEGIENIKITNLLINIRSDFSKLNLLLYNALVSYNKVTLLGNKELDFKIKGAKEKLKHLYKTINLIDKDYDILLGILGHNKEKKYLILFQNNDEIRATGGFIGSLATVTIKNGLIIDFTKDDVYAYEWDINKVYKIKEIAPEGLNKITNTFGLRDANYFIDFESSSKSINFFLKKINKNVDGIIYINQNTFLDFLEITGPIEFKKINDIINKDNFSLIISTLVEAQSFKIGTLGTPKKILFDFATLFLEKLKKDKDYITYINTIIKNINSRDLVFYSFNSEENNLLWKLGLNGKLNYSTTLDFSYPVYTSIGGNKSDRYIKLKYKKNIIINNDCSIKTNLNIYRSHLFSEKEEFKVIKLLDQYPIKDKTIKDILNIQGKGENKSYIRVVLPKNIEITPSKGMNIHRYKNTTVVDFYMNTRVLETTNFNIEYTINNKECLDYNFKLYKQPGIKDYDIDINNNGKVVKIDSISSDYIY